MFKKLTAPFSNQPKFELHLQIYDLNNVPLVSGSSFIKWHIAASIHAEHRGRTPKCPIANHRVDYGPYSRLVPSLRIPVDRSSRLGDCVIELEVLQEFPASGGRDERVPLGVVRLNLSEFVEESDAITSRRRSASLGAGGGVGGAYGASMGPPPIPRVVGGAGPDMVEEGIVRRYLMQESKINSTLKVGILMVQTDGERNYVPPPLKTAPVFGGIAGIMVGEPVEQDDAGHMPSISKPRDAAEVQDLYRRALAATWCAQPGEPPADAVIENLFAGGDGWNPSSTSTSARVPRPSSPYADDLESSGSLSGDEGHGGTLRASDLRRAQRRLAARARLPMTLTSRGSSQTIRGDGGGGISSSVVGGGSGSARGGGVRAPPKEDDDISGVGDGGRSRSGSLTSLAPTLGSSGRGRDLGLKRAREISETEARDDMVAWRLMGSRM